MLFSSGHTGCKHAIHTLFAAPFADAEGAAQGALIGALVTNLMERTPTDKLFVFFGYEGAVLVGCIMFSRLSFEQDDKTVFILSPVAMKSDRQKQGIGQTLISYGVAELRRAGVDVVLTYGDPNYYSKVGFRQISETIARAPLKLSQPHGWQGQSLSQTKTLPVIGPSRCVDPLNKPALW